MMLSQPRVLLAMARDGLVPTGFFGDIHEKFRTPWKSTILTGVFVALMAALLPLRVLAELVNIGTLLAFVIVCAAVLIMRGDAPRGRAALQTPFFPLVPILGILSLPGADVLAAGRELVAAARLAGDRLPHLLRLRAVPQRDGEEADGGEALRRWWNPPGSSSANCAGSIRR